MSTLGHKAQRKVIETVIGGAVKHASKDVGKAMLKYIDIGEKYLKGTWSPAAFEQLRKVFEDPNHKYYKYADYIFNNINAKQIKLAAMNLGFESGFTGYKKVKENEKKYGCKIPWILLIDPTSACNLKCTGCWAAEYGHKMSLTYEEIDDIVTQAEELGIHAFLFTGGEPLMRKKDLMKLCKKHNESAFQCFTNGTLIDEEFCRQMLEVGNFVPNLSIEGFEEANDSRRGKGVFEKVMHAMDLMKAHQLMFGVSVCYTSKNYEVVTSDEFMDLLISKGVLYGWYFHYMPTGNDADVSLMLTPEQRTHMYNRIRQIRDFDGGKPIFLIDFQNDGEMIGGCIAGGKYYCHINSNGDVEPCVFIHYSNANIREKSLIECFQQPLFREYQAAQPFNKNHLRPCPMLENPEKLREIVKKSGAHSTDATSPEDVDHLCDKCVSYAENWAPVAKEIWENSMRGKRALEKEAAEGGEQPVGKAAQAG